MSRASFRPVQAPFPWFGGKLGVIAELNARFGVVENRVDAFCGSAAWFLASPPAATETMNDMSGDVVNAYRAIRADPDAVAYYCDYPMSELDFLARKVALKETLPERAARLAADPDWYDARAAGYFLYAQALQIGLNIYAPGPWIVENGMLVRRPGARGIERHRPQMTSAAGVKKNMMEVVTPRGVKKNLIDMTSRFGVASERRNTLIAWFRAIAERLRNVRIVCGDFRRVLTPAVTTQHGVTAILLDPPYPSDQRDPTCYAHDEEAVWYDAARWAIAHGNNLLLRIAVCGYWTPETDALFPASWSRFRWVAQGGYANRSNQRGRENKKRECVWFSPHCAAVQQELF